MDKFHFYLIDKMYRSYKKGNSKLNTDDVTAKDDVSKTDYQPSTSKVDSESLENIVKDCQPSASKTDSESLENVVEHCKPTSTSKAEDYKSSTSKAGSSQSVNSKRKSDDKIDEVTDLIWQRIRRKKFKTNFQHVDFVAELGYKQFMQLVITEIFSSLSDKDLTASFCVSKTWNYVLDQNGRLRRRKEDYVRAQIEFKRKFGLENWPLKKKVTNTKKRRVFGELTNRRLTNRINF